MSDRRVVLGKRQDGTFGLDVSLPGHDAYTGNRDDAGAFSFSSDWADIVPISQISLHDKAASSPTFDAIAIPNNGYIPHVEVRMVSGLRIFDDTFTSGISGIPAIVIPGTLYIPATTFAYRSLYVVYKTPMAL